MLRDTETSFGFEGVSDMARAILENLQGQNSTELEACLRRLRLYISRIVAAYEDAPSAV
jgi:hypothetical protein